MRMYEAGECPDTGFDIIVVGAGASGATLAAALVHGGLRVALIEAGPDQNRAVNRIPALAFMASINPETNWNFETAPIPELHNRRQFWSQGKMVGGSSGLNGMLWMRGTRHDYDLWERNGCPGWGWEAALDAYRAIEGSDRDTAYHGRNGALKIRRSDLDLPLTAPFLQAMAEAGLPQAENINADIEEGFGTFDVNVSQGQRCGVRQAWLQPLQANPNLKIFHDTTAIRLVTDAGKVTGVVLKRGDTEFILSAGREVVLCCGAILTPALLMRSGFGPAAHLQGAGIEVKRDCPGIGENLHNHPAVALRYFLSAPLSAARWLRPGPALAAGLRYALTRSGPLAQSYVAMGGLFRSQPGDAPSDMMAVVMPALVKRAEVGAKIGSIFDWRHGFAVNVSLARQKSRGRIRLDPRSPFRDPVIAPNYLSAPEDLCAMTAGVLRLRCAIATSQDLAPLVTETGALASARDAAALQDAIRAACGTFYHPAGTCRMGGEDAPVRPDLRLRGAAGLRIADPSVVPLPMGATMHAPSILIGYRAAQMILKDLREAGASTGNP